jgi:glycosyltransferase involved in cell wall biosynthesis
MKSQTRVLFGVPTRHHIEIALDELVGLVELGFTCDQFPYAAKEGDTSKVGRLYRVIQNAFKLIAKARQFNPDVVYINSRFEVLGSTRDFITIFLFKLFYYKKVLFIIKSHGSDIEILDSGGFFLKRIVLPFLKKNVAAWLFLSTEERDNINKANYFLKSSIFVTKNVVRTNQFKIDPSFRKAFNIPGDCKVLLFVGRIINSKGIHEVIDAFHGIQKKHKTVLIVVGGGSEMEAIKNKVIQYNLTGSVILTEEFIPEQETIRYYSNSDVLVFPTFHPEGFPMALFNSVAAGLAIVTTPIRAAKDFLTEPENCFWVKPQDSASVFQALDKLLSNEPEMNQMRINNKIKGQIFSKQYISNELAAIINNIMVDGNN